MRHRARLVVVLAALLAVLLLAGVLLVPRVLEGRRQAEREAQLEELTVALLEGCLRAAAAAPDVDVQTDRCLIEYQRQWEALHTP